MSNNQLVFDPAAADVSGTGVSHKDLIVLAPRLESARRELLDDLDLLRSGKQVPAAKEPLDAGFIDLPDRLLAEHKTNPLTSELSRIITAADEMASLVDRAVVIGIGGSYMGTRSLFEAMCHPYFNQLDRKQRNNRPRLYFIGHNVDNDTAQGLLDILGRDRKGKGIEDRWGIVVVSKSGGTLEPAVAFRQFFTFLRDTSPPDTDLRKTVIAITGGEAGSTKSPDKRSLSIPSRSRITLVDDSRCSALADFFPPLFLDWT